MVGHVPTYVRFSVWRDLLEVKRSKQEGGGRVEKGMGRMEG